MICPKCGRPVQTSAVICAGCDFILDTDFLGDEILDEEQALRPGAGGVDPAAFNLADAVILGDIDDEAQSFETADSGFHIKESTNARLYVSGRSQAMMAPDAVPAVLDDAPGLKLTPFEKHILAFIDGKRPVEAIRRQAGLDEVEVKTALATLADKGIIAVVGRALVEADVSLETQPRGNRRKLRGTMVGAIGAGFDDTDRAIEDAFRTQTNLRALSELSRREKTLGKGFSSDDLSDEGSGAFSNNVTQATYDFESDAETQAREVTGLRQQISDGLPSDADRFTVPGLGVDARSMISETPDSRKRDFASRAPTVAKARNSGSDGFDDFGKPSQLSSVFVNESESEENPLIDDYSDLMSDSQPIMDPPTRPARAVTHLTLPSVSEVSFISSIEEDEASGVLAQPRAPVRFQDRVSPDRLASERIDPSEQMRANDPSLLSAISFISEEAVIALPDGQLNDNIHESLDSDEQATQVLPDFGKKLVSFGQNKTLPPEAEEPPSESNLFQREPDLKTANAASMTGSIPYDGSSSAGPFEEHGGFDSDAFASIANTTGNGAANNASVDHRKARAAKLFNDAKDDFQNGRLAAARMHGKLACLYDPGNALFQSSLLEWERAATRRQTKPPDSANPPQEFAVMYERAQQLEASGQHETAAQTLEQAAELFPNIAAIHNRLGVLLALRMKDYDTAVVWIQKAISLEPDNLHYKNNLGKIEVRRRRP